MLDDALIDELAGVLIDSAESGASGSFIHPLTRDRVVSFCGLSRDRVSRMLEPVALDDIRNYVAISEELATAGQPTEEQLRQLKDHGFQVVVNLGLLDPRYCLPDEAGTVATLGMVYREFSAAHAR